jgi:hypothetical protein
MEKTHNSNTYVSLISLPYARVKNVFFISMQTFVRIWDMGLLPCLVEINKCLVSEQLTKLIFVKNKYGKTVDFIVIFDHVLF